MSSEANSCSIPEEILVDFQLESIFTPSLRQRRESAYNITPSCGDKYNTDKLVSFVHYTTAESALSIINNKELWLRQTSCMSDYREVQHGFDTLKSCFGDKTKRDTFCGLLDSFAPGAAYEAIQSFDQHIGSVESSTYIASISEHDPEENQHGRLSMWRAFGGNTGRVAIIFKLPWYKAELLNAMNALQIRFGPVAYIAENDFDKEYQRILKNIYSNREFLCSVGHTKIVNSIFNMLLMNTVSLKHSGFKEEKEWRIIHLPLLWSSPLMKPEIKVINGIPQQIYKLPFDSSKDAVLSSLDLSKMLDRLIIGPTEYPWPMFKAFSDALQSIGMEDAHKRVFISGIPIRT